MCNFAPLLNLKSHIMKKFIYPFLLFLGVFSSITTYAEETPIDVTISIENLGNNDGSDDPRTIHKIIEATIDTDLGLLSLYFNENLANVNITVKNANGNIVASTTCNTSITSSTYLNVPTVSGTYSIDIYGDCVTAYGEYDIN